MVSEVEHKEAAFLLESFVGGSSSRAQAEQAPARAKHGQVYCRKVAKNFGQSRFLSAREIEHGRFRALFARSFYPKMQNGRTSPKSKKNRVPCGECGR